MPALEWEGPGGNGPAPGCRRRSARQRVCGEPPESARIPRKRPRPKGMAAGRRRLAAPQAMTFTARGWGSPRRPAIYLDISGERDSDTEIQIPLDLPDGMWKALP